MAQQLRLLDLLEREDVIDLLDLGINRLKIYLCDTIWVHDCMQMTICWYLFLTQGQAELGAHYSSRVLMVANKKLQGTESTSLYFIIVLDIFWALLLIHLNISFMIFDMGVATQLWS